MGKDFVIGTPGDPESRFRMLRGMGNLRAIEFVRLSEAIAEWYALPAGIDDIGNDYYNLDPEQFCALVDAVFADPVDLLAGWAQYAAAMYEGIKRRRCRWVWAEESMAQRNFRPRYDSNDNAAEWGENTLHPPPGAVRFFAEDERLLAVMPRRRAHMFVGIAEMVSHSVDRPSGLSAGEGARYNVEAEAFCALVEEAVSASTDWFCPWAQHAAAMYEVIRDAWYDWVWAPRDSPSRGFVPARQALELGSDSRLAIALDTPSGKTIAFKGWRFWQERAEKGEG